MEEEEHTVFVKLVSAEGAQIVTFHTYDLRSCIVCSSFQFLEGHEFFIDRRCAMVSGTIKSMLSGQFAESRGEIRFPEIPGIVLEKVCQYLYYRVRYTNSSQRVPEFNIDPSIALDLLMVANYLDC